jgi:hypothetical protein
MNTNYNYRNLGAAIVLQATKDYCNPTTTKAMRKAILKDLHSSHLNQLSDGISLVVAEQLEKHPQEIAKRLKMCKEELK